VADGAIADGRFNVARSPGNAGGSRYWLAYVNCRKTKALNLISMSNLIYVGLDVLAKKSAATPKKIIDKCKARLRAYDEII
jgi:hypothetical protein